MMEVRVMKECRLPTGEVLRAGQNIETDEKDIDSRMLTRLIDKEYVHPLHVVLVVHDSVIGVTSDVLGVSGDVIEVTSDG